MAQLLFESPPMLCCRRLARLGLSVRPWRPLAGSSGLAAVRPLTSTRSSSSSSAAPGDAIHGLGTDSKAIEDYYEEWGPEQYEANLRMWGYMAPTLVTEVIGREW